MLEVKDLAGLSEPLKKLISVIANGIGAISKPYLIKKTADAKAYEIKVIAQAIKANQPELKAIDYSSDKIELHSLDIPLIQAELDINYRAKHRIEYQEQKRQQNIEEITQKAANQIRSETEVSNEPVDEDWTSRFFNYAQDVSDEEMQILWAQILAGEVKKPKSYSLRTLELLKNLTKEEAEVFTKFAKLRIIAANTNMIYNQDDGKYLEDNYGIKFTDRLLLTELGLLSTEANLEWHIMENKDTQTNFLIRYGNKGIILYRKPNTPKQTIRVLVFTKTGSELANLVDVEYSEGYIKRICSSFSQPTVDIVYGDIALLNNNEVRLINEVKYVKE